jgi:hypothetical protein
MTTQEILFGFGFGAFLMALAGIFYGLYRHKKRIQDLFTGFAADHDLDLQLGSYPRAEGEIDGHAFSVGSYRQHMLRREYGKVNVVQFAMVLDLKVPPPDGLLVLKRPLVERGGVKTGDEAFNKRHLVRATDPEAALAYLNETRRVAMAELVNMEGGLYGDQLAIIRTGFKVEREWFEARLAALRKAAVALEA